MNMIGFASIVFGLMIVCTRTPLVLAPAATLRWFKELVESNRRMRLFVLAFLPVGVLMIWAGASDPSGLSGVLSFFGWLMSVGFVVVFLFPAGYRSLVLAVLPKEVNESRLVGWRILGSVAIGIGVLFIFAGVEALI